MRLLALDAAGSACSVGLFSGLCTVVLRHEVMDRGHAERIVPAIAGAMADAGWSWRELDLVAPGIGPGNFTGIRAAVAVARALALAADLPCLGISTLQALAATAIGQPTLCIVPGRGETVYAQRFDAEGQALTGPLAIPKSQIEAFREPGDRVLADGSVVDASAVARAASLQLARGVAPAPGYALRPLYLRDADARADAGRPLAVAIA